MRRPLGFLMSGLFAFALLASTSVVTTSPASAATIAPTTRCSNGVDNTGGLGLICQITIVNRITASGGTARVTVRECHGAAGDPTAACRTTVRNLTQPVTQVNQCNNSINGGGGTLRCSVKVTNNFIGLSTGRTAATVNQCVGSGESGGIGTTIICVPFPATTSGATITQCNGSANGGTLVSLQCSATGTKPSTHGVRINQCNNSANGGGALVICSANITNIRLAIPAGSSGGGSNGGGGSGVTPPNTSTDEFAAPRTGSGSLVIAGLLVFALSLITAVRWFGARRRTR